MTIPSSDKTVGASGHVTDHNNITTTLTSHASSLTDLAFRPLYRKNPPKAANRTLFTSFQSGHGWTATVSGGSSNLNDTTDPGLGSQSVSFTTAASGNAQINSPTLSPTFDFTGKSLAILVKIDDTTTLSSIAVYLGNDSVFTNHYYLTAYNGGASNQSTTPSGEWTWVHFCYDFWSSTTGTPTDTAFTDIRVRFNAATGEVCTGQLGAVGYFTKQTAFASGVVSFTFDDDYVAQFTEGREYLDKYGYSGTAFVIQDLVGTTDKLTLAQLTQLQDRHGWAIGGHAYTSANHDAGLPQLTADQRETDLSNLKAWLLENGFAGADLFAYPLGDEDSASRESVGQFFSFARQTFSIPRLNLPLDQPLRARAYTVTSATSTATLQSEIDAAIANDYWLILIFHNLVAAAASGNTQYLISSFQTVVDYCNSSGIAVRNVHEVLSAIE